MPDFVVHHVGGTIVARQHSFKVFLPQGTILDHGLDAGLLSVW